MNTRSVRFRLTLWYSLAFFVTAAIVFAIFYLVTGQILYRQTNITLNSHGEKVVEVLSRQNTGMHTMLEKQAFIQDFSQIPGMLVVIMDSSGRVINSSATDVPGSATLSRLATRSQDENKPIYSDEVVAGSSMRFWVTTIRNGQGETTGTVLVAHPIDVIKNSLENLLLLLAAVLLASIVPAILGGYLLAKRALAPIGLMSGELKRISSESLDKRVPNPRTGDELEELSETFNNLLDRLGESFRRERQFIGDVAHELKTPLSTLQSSTEIMLSKKRSNEQYRQGYDEALVDIKRLSSTLRNILDLAWSDADNAALTGEKFNLSGEVAELKEITTKMAIAKKIIVSGNVAQNLFIRGKKDKLARALLNIVDNAIKYTPEQGKVTLDLFRRNNHAVVEIKDTGLGIAKEDLPHIFDRFYRGSKSGKVLGSGLGLAIAKAAIASHHGEIKVKSIVGRGTTFLVDLPLAPLS